MATENDKIDDGSELSPEQLAAAAKLRGDLPADDDKKVDDDKVDDDKKDDPDAETEEEKAEREAAEAEAERKRRARIPLARHEEVLNKARKREEALNQEILKLKSAMGSKQETNELSKLETELENLRDKYEEAVFEGKKDEAKAMRKQIQAKQDVLIDAKTTAKTDVARQGAINQLKFDAVLVRVEAAHPELNPDGDQYDEDKADEVKLLAESFIARGFTNDVALAKAVKYVMGDPKSSKGGDDETEAVRKARAEAARTKAAAAAGKQPADASKTGKDSDRGGKGGELGINVMQLDQKKFAKLDEETIARLRGDVI